MKCVYCGATENIHEARNSDPQGEPLPGTHVECDDSSACLSRAEARRVDAKARARRRYALEREILTRFERVATPTIHPSAETIGDPSLRPGQVVLSATNNHWRIDPPDAAERFIWAVQWSSESANINLSGRWFVRRAAWTPDLEAQLRELAAI